MQSASVPVFERMLGSLLQWLDKAEAHAQARSWAPELWLGQRLAPDMLPLVKQVQIACDAAKSCVSRLAGQDVPSWPDTEATLDELRARVRRTLEHVRTVSASQINGSEAREIVLPTRSGEPLRMSGEDFLKHRVLPNFYFHLSTTYALLRQGGVELGKSDYLGR